MIIVFSIAANELRRLIRDKVVLALSLLVIGLLSVSTLTGWQYHQQISTQHEEAAQLARAQWEQQGEKNPHSAAHYGTFAFKPVSLLGIFEPGVERYTGVSVYLEAHQQNFASYSPAEDQHASLRFAELTPAFIFAYLFPLFIIFIGFRSITGEKESGMYRFMRGQGITLRDLIFGKALGLWAITLLLYLPFLLLGLLLILIAASDADTLLRFALMSTIWLLYFGVMVHLSIAVSALAKSSGAAMVTLLALWILSTLLMPRLATNLAADAHPVPSTTEVRQAIARDLSEGIDGHNPYSEHSVAFRDSVLQAHGAESIDDLPFNFRGLMLQESEEFEKQIYDYHLARIGDIHQSQIGVFYVSALFSPTMAARMASMSAAGTDMHNFNHFLDAAEAYRIELMRELNMDLKINAIGERAAGYSAGEDFFAQNVAFNYEPPEEIMHAPGQGRAVLLNGIWFAASLGFLFLIGARKKDA